jgi:neutral trehalase
VLIYVQANSILYFTLQNAITLASIMNDTSNSTDWATSANGIPPAANALLWDDETKLYWDNDTQKVLHPQDGNAWAVLSGVANGTRAAAIVTLWKDVGFGHTALLHLRGVLPSRLSCQDLRFRLTTKLEGPTAQ